MHLSQTVVAQVRKYLADRLPDYSSADPKILSDYIIALISKPDKREDIRKECLKELGEFMGDSTDEFVDILFELVDSLLGKGQVDVSEPPTKRRRLLEHAKRNKPESQDDTTLRVVNLTSEATSGALNKPMTPTIQQSHSITPHNDSSSPPAGTLVHRRCVVQNTNANSITVTAKPPRDFTESPTPPKRSRWDRVADNSRSRSKSRSRSRSGSREGSHRSGRRVHRGRRRDRSGHKENSRSRSRSRSRQRRDTHRRKKSRQEDELQLLAQVIQMAQQGVSFQHLAAQQGLDMQTQERLRQVRMGRGKEDWPETLPPPATQAPTGMVSVPDMPVQATEGPASAFPPSVLASNVPPVNIGSGRPDEQKQTLMGPPEEMHLPAPPSGPPLGNPMQLPSHLRPTIVPDSKILRVNVVNPYAARQLSPNVQATINVPPMGRGPPHGVLGQFPASAPQIPYRSKKFRRDHTSFSGRKRAFSRMNKESSFGKETALEDKRQLFAYNIPAYLNNVQHLSSWFSRFGTIENIQVHRQHSKAYVQFSSHEDANNALNDPEPILGEEQIKVIWAHYNRPDFDRKANQPVIGKGKSSPSKDPSTVVPVISLIHDNKPTRNKVLDSIYSVSNAQLQHAGKQDADSRGRSGSAPAVSSGEEEKVKYQWMSKEYRDKIPHKPSQEEMDEVELILSRSIPKDMTSNIVKLQAQVKQFLEMLEQLSKSNDEISPQKEQENDGLKKRLMKNVSSCQEQLKKLLTTQKERNEMLKEHRTAEQKKQKLDEQMKQYQLMKQAESSKRVRSKYMYGRGRARGRGSYRGRSYGYYPRRGRGRGWMPRGRGRGYRGRSRGRGSSKPRGPRLKADLSAMSKDFRSAVVVAANLPSHWDESTIRTHFQQYGKVSEVDIFAPSSARIAFEGRNSAEKAYNSGTTFTDPSGEIRRIKLTFSEAPTEDLSIPYDEIEEGDDAKVQVEDQNVSTDPDT